MVSPFALFLQPRRLAMDAATVDDDRFAVHVASRPGGQKHDNAGQFLRLAETHHGDLGDRPRIDLRVLPPDLAETGLDDARGDGVDADVVLPPLLGHDLGQHDDGGLGRAIDSQLPRPDAGDGGRVDDGAAALGLHDPRCHLAQEEDALQVDIHGDVVGLFILVHEAAVVGVGSGVVHEDVDASELLHDLFDERPGILRLADMGGDGQALHAFG